MIPRPVFRYLALVAFATAAISAPLVPAFFTGRAMESWVYLFFAPICHQIPDRSFFLFGGQLAVCHRCFGIYAGFWVGTLSLPVFPAFSRWLLVRPRRFLLFVVPLAVDFLLDNTAASRFSTGILVGFPAAFFVWAALEQLQWSPRTLMRKSHEPSAT